MKITKNDIYQQDKWYLDATFEFDTEKEAIEYLEALKQDIALGEYINEHFSMEEFDAKVKELLREIGYKIDGVEILI